MASRSQTQDDYIGVSPIQNNNALELFPFDYNARDNPFHFPFSGPQISPSENLCGYQLNFLSGVPCDFDFMTNVDEHNRYTLNNPVNQDGSLRNNTPILDNQGFSFRNVGPGTISLGSHNFTNNMMGVNRGVNTAPYLENNHGPISTNSISVNTESRGDISRNFVFGREPKFEQTTHPSVYNNQFGVNSSQPYNEDELDGRFLSLGNQGQVLSYMNSHGGKASHHIGDSFISSNSSQQGLTSYSSYNNVRDGLSVFKNNVGSGTARLDSTDDYYSSGFDINPMAKIDEVQMNMHHYIPTPNTITSECGKKPDPIIDLSGPLECSGPNSMLPNVPQYDDVSSRSKKRRMQRASFNSSVLRSNHQIAAQSQQNSDLSADLLLPSSGSNIGTSDGQGKPDFGLGFVSQSSGFQIAENNSLHMSNRFLPAGQIYPPFPIHGQPSSVQEASVTPNNKRTINLPPRDSNQNQRRKLTPQTPVRQFSPDLLQNALGQIPIGRSTPDITSSKGFNFPPPLKDFPPTGWPRNPSWPFPDGITPNSNTTSPQNPIPLTPPFLPPPQYSPIARSDSSSIPVICVDSPPRDSQPVNAPPIALARTMDSQRGSSSGQISVVSAKRVMTPNSPVVANRLSSGIGLRRSNLLRTSSTMNRAALTDLKKSLPSMAGLAKMDPALRASQVLGSMPRIKWKGFEIPPTVGYKCMICKRDLTFTPDGPVLQPAIPPEVAVLPCGHTFHDQCLMRITPDDQSKDPPCIPCAVDN